MKFSIWIYALVFLFLGFTHAQYINIPLGFEEHASGNDSYVPYHRSLSPRIALALSGGGARGIAQIGVLKVLERHGIPIDGITGTSMGAIIGGLYAIGYTAHDLDSLARQIAWDEIIRDTPPRQQLFLAEKAERSRHLFQLRFQGFSPDIQSAFTSGVKFNQLLSELIWKARYPVSRNFDDLAIPFRAITTDLLTGEKVVLSEGSLIEALRASMAIPLLFTPVRKNGAWLVDGGLVQNLPVDDARNLKCDLIIAVDTSSKLRIENNLKAPWEIADQVTTIMSQESIEAQYQKADIGIQPLLEELSNTDFSKIDDIIQVGEKAAEAKIYLIDSLLSKRDLKFSDRICPVKYITVSGCQYETAAYYLNKLNLDTRYPISTNDIRWSAHKLYQSDLLTNITASYDTSQHILHFQVSETPRIKRIVISGNHEYSDSLLLSLIETRPHQRIRIQQGKKDLRKLLAYYQGAGFTLVRLRSSAVQDHVLYIDLNEGKIDKVKIRGLDITKPFVIQRELTINKGELFNIAKVNQSVQNIYSTGYFEDVRFEVVPQENDYRLIFHVTEQKFSLARVGLKYDLERRSKGFIEVVQDNIWGIGAEGTLTGLLGSKDEQLKGSLRADRLYTSFLTSKLEIGYNRSQYDYYLDHKIQGSYKLSQLYATFGAGRQMQRLGTVFAEIRSEIFNIQADSSVAVNPDKKFIQTVCIRSEVDTRDRMPFPSRGKYHRLEYETSARFLGSEIDFIKLSSWLESYYPIHRDFVFHPKFFWGTSGLNTPFSKQFRMGGLNSFIGLPDYAWIGKRNLLLSSTLRYRLPVRQLVKSYLSIRYDFGGIWEKYAKINLDDFKHGIGIILSMNTLVGPLHLAAGRMSDGQHQYYFSLGHHF
ncbi:patatin-like phospholipase family protein [bacterium]|nr:patatin-like phospholipase family protein [bacterium]